MIYVSLNNMAMATALAMEMAMAMAMELAMEMAMAMALAMARYYLKKPPYLGGFIIAGIA